MIKEQVTGLDPVHYTYDAKGRLTNITQGLRTTALNYDTLNQLSSITDPAGRTVSFGYDLAGRATQETLPDGRVIGYTYDSNGNVTSITPPGRPSHGFTYTGVNLENSYLPPNIGAGTNNTAYTYNLDKQLTQVARPDGQSISLTYDAGGRLTSLQAGALGGLSYVYDTAGRLGSIKDSGGETLSYTYDGSLVMGKAWAGLINGSVGYVYNNDLRVVSETVNGQNPVSFAYDNDGLLTSAGAMTISRNAQNGLLTGTALGSVTTSQTFSTQGEQTQFTAQNSGLTVYDAQYTRDNLGRLTQEPENVNGITTLYGYTYDQAGRLTDVTKNNSAYSHYGYDTNGNRTLQVGPNGTITATYDAQDRLLTYGSNSYTYTANGELQSKVTPTGTTFYNYDVLGNLLSAMLPDGTQIEYIIDGQNRRIGKKVNGALVQGLLYENQLNPIAELDGAGNVVSRFVYGTKGNVPDYMIKNGATYRIIADHLGSPRLIVDSANGTIAQQLDYDEFGNVLQDTNPGFQPFGFAGGLYDAHTKIVRFGARDYDSETGRWTAKDPIRFSGGDTNLYGYTANDPINWIDPSGLSKGGKQNINTEGFNKKSDPKDVEEAMNEAKQCKQMKRYKKLKGLLKVIKRGGTMGLILGDLLDSQIYVPEDETL